MNESTIQKISATEKFLSICCIPKFNPVFTISENGKSICLNGQPIISNDDETFGEGVFVERLGYQLLRHAELEGENQPLKCMAHNIVYGIYPSKDRFFTEDFVKTQFETLDADTQADLMKSFGYQEANRFFFSQLEGFVNLGVRDYAIEHSDNEAIKAWLQANIDQDFLTMISSVLNLGRGEWLHQYFEMAQCKDVIIKFLAKYPHMKAMLRTVWLAHEAAPERKIFSQIKTLADMEQGNFMVELYNQEYRYYQYSDAHQKFLADAESWQWLLTQPQKTIDILMKHYNVNDGVTNTFAYHSFGRFRENLSVVAHLNIETKLAQVILKDLASSSITHDRFALCVNRNEKDLAKEEFHSGKNYLEQMKKLFAYMDAKGMDLDTRCKFIRTFKENIGHIGTHIWYQQKHKNSTLSVNEIIDQWVQDKFSSLKTVNRNTYVPETLALV